MELGATLGGETEGGLWGECELFERKTQNLIIQEGFCQCGCGQKTRTARCNNRVQNHIKGKPLKYISGHQQKLRGSRRPQWKGGRRIDKNGYILIHSPNHPNARNGYVREHILVAEKALGKYLPEFAVIHHFNGQHGDNSNSNLVICENQTYHLLLEQRTRALKVCGNANWRKCWICKEYDDPINLCIRKNRVYHRKCNTDYSRNYYLKNPGYFREWQRRNR